MRYLKLLTVLFLLFDFIPLTAKEGQSLTKLSLPFTDWYLEMDLSDFNIGKEKLSRFANKKFLNATGKDSNFAISVHLDQYSDSKNCNKCRIYFIHKLKPVFVPDHETIITEENDMAFWEFTVKEYDNKKLDHRNLNIVFAKDSICINVHISKLHYTDDDSLIFNKVKQSLKFNSKDPVITQEMIDKYDLYLKTQSEPIRREIMNSDTSLIAKLAYIHTLDSLSDKYRLINEFLGKAKNGRHLAFMELGILYVVNNEFNKADSLISIAIPYFNKNFLPYHFRGLARNNLGMYEQAIKDFTTAIKYDSNVVHPLMQRAEAYWRLKDYEQAIFDYSKVLNIDNKVEDAYVFRGIIFETTGKFEAAIKDWEKAIKLNPDWEKELRPMIDSAENKTK